MAILLGLDMTFDAFQLPFFILMFFLFYKKRTSFPKVLLVYTISNIVLTTMISNMMVQSNLGILDPQYPKPDILVTLLISLVLVVYLRVSKRVEQTFIYSLKKE